MDFNEPQSRNEAILQNILGANNVLVDPQSEIEEILQTILKNTPYTEEGRSRIARLLIAIKNNGTWNELPTISRNEEILYCILNGEKYTEEPQSRIEELLIDWSNAGSQGYEKTVSGNPISITDALAEPAIALKVLLNPKQDLHGYDHPWPAGGGENIFYHEGNLNSTSYGLTATFDGDSQTISITGTNTSTSAYILLNIPCTGDIPRETPLSRAFFNAPSDIYINFVYRKNGSWASVADGGSIPSDADAINIQVGIYAYATTLNATEIRVQIQRGSTAPTAYAPYSNICPISGWDEVNVFVGETESEEDATKYTVSFESQGTVYGGTVDIVSGVLVVDRVCVENSTKALKNENESGYFWYSTNADMRIPRISGLNARLITNRFKVVPNTTTSGSDGEISYYANGIIRWKEKGEMTRNEYIGYLAENPMQLSYELAEPQTYQLTPQEVQMLLGSNTVWSDGDNMELTYKGSNPALQLSAMLKTNSNNLKSLKLKK